MKTIIQIGDETLRAKVEKVSPNEITSKKIQDIISDMKESLASQDDGVAIAAPQIGISLSIFVVSGKIFSSEDEVRKDDQVYINPKIIKKSRKKVPMEEGCLSVRGTFGQVNRCEKITIEAYNEKGEKITKGGSGLLAQIFQHETDHLEGILFIDKATQLVPIVHDHE